MLRGLSWVALALHLAICRAQSFTSDEQMPLVLAPDGSLASCHRTCAGLRDGGHANLTTFYPQLPSGFDRTYFSSAQGDMIPICVVRPRSAAAVAEVVSSLRTSMCPFAVKSGGHSLAPGTSAIHNGLALDLHDMDEVTVSDDGRVVGVGAGSTWGPVYAKLEPLGLIVAGGRGSAVGVGGYIMGGGISYLSRRYGWTLDNVLNFEVVLPNGTLVNANPASDPDLYFALRGGGSSFGIVTRFDLEAHAQDLFWGGTDIHLMANLRERQARLGVRNRFDGSLHSALIIVSEWVQSLAVALGFGTRSDDLIDAFFSLASDNQTDDGAHAFISQTWVPSLKFFTIVSTYVHGRGVERPKALEALTSLPSMRSTRRLTRMSDLADETDRLCKHGFETGRHNWRSVSFKADASLAKKIWDIVFRHAHEFRLAVPDVQISTNLQLLTKHEISLFARNGGNAFGVEVEDGPLCFFSLTISHKHEKDDEAVERLAVQVTAEAVALAKDMGLYHPFMYPNYAALGMDVYSGYSAANRRRLLDLQERYDPGRVLAGLQPKHLRLSEM